MMVWDASGSVSSVCTARCTTTHLPKGALTQLIWSATGLVSAKHRWKWGPSPYNSKGNCSKGQVVLAQALSKGNASSHSEWISALEIKLTERDCASFLTSLLEWSKVISDISVQLPNPEGGGEDYRRAGQPKKAYWHPEMSAWSEKGQEQFHFPTITIWHDLYHTVKSVSCFQLGHILPGIWCSTVFWIYHENNVDNTLVF